MGLLEERTQARFFIRLIYATTDGPVPRDEASEALSKLSAG